LRTGIMLLMGQSRDIKRKYHQNVAGSSLDPCVYCGGVATTIDHIQPKSLGGTNDIENLAPMCKKCNNDKGGSSVLLAMFQNDLKRRMTQNSVLGREE